MDMIPIHVDFDEDDPRGQFKAPVGQVSRAAAGGGGTGGPLALAERTHTGRAGVTARRGRACHERVVAGESATLVDYIHTHVIIHTHTHTHVT